MSTIGIASRILLAIGATSTLAAAGALGCSSSANQAAGTTGGGGATTASSTHAGTTSSSAAGTGGSAEDGGGDAGDDGDAMGDGPPCVRRPFLVDAVPRAGGVTERSDWLAALDDEGAPPATDLSAAALAEAWALDGTQEHASIAAFGRFTMLLVAVGAPPELVIGSQQASIDEVTHARGCFALARRYGGRSVGPGPVSLRGALPEDPSLAGVAALTVHEGCVGETLGVLLATEQLAGATDPAVRAVLARIVRDEQRHAELAWRFVRWALSQGDPAVRVAVARAFAEARRVTEAMRFGDPPGTDPIALRAHGRLGGEEARTLVRRGLTEIIEPCRRALLDDGAPIPAPAPDVVATLDA